ncbi:ABC transporter substrate-binding protein [Kribbella catacumbae]|uniref:ABC transporter substrate-binding protein n=1 Tax=Kribbella catacumbae TaxID=460086 RepID=UPI00036D62CF|nr:ABC transporter substrate-binding protein [Kribbella catacumbae]
MRFPPARPSRRSVLLGAASAGAVALLAACSNDQKPAGTTVQSTGPWEFTDDRGVKITRPERPAKVVAQVSAAAALWDLGVRPIGIFGATKGADGKPNNLAGSVDLSTVTSVTETYGEFEVEKFAALQPDLLVAPIQVPKELWYVPKDSVEAIEAIAPTLGVNYLGRSVDRVIDRYAEVAAALGADLKAAPVVAAKAEFAAASKGLSELTAKKKGLRVLFLSGGPDKLYFGNPAAFADLTLLKSLGLELITPKFDPAEPHWEEVSWEVADKYPADVILYDARSAAVFTTDQAKYPTYARLPAVKAGQALAWNPETPTSWAAFAPALRQLTTDLSRLRPVAD